MPSRSLSFDDPNTREVSPYRIGGPQNRLMWTAHQDAQERIMEADNHRKWRGLSLRKMRPRVIFPTANWPYSLRNGRVLVSKCYTNDILGPPTTIRRWSFDNRHDFAGTTPCIDDDHFKLSRPPHNQEKLSWRTRIGKYLRAVIIALVLLPYWLASAFRDTVRDIRHRHQDRLSDIEPCSLKRSKIRVTWNRLKDCGMGLLVFLAFAFAWPYYLLVEMERHTGVRHRLETNSVFAAATEDDVVSAVESHEDLPNVQSMVTHFVDLIEAFSSGFRRGYNDMGEKGASSSTPQGVGNAV